MEVLNKSQVVKKSNWLEMLDLVGRNSFLDESEAQTPTKKMSETEGSWQESIGFPWSLFVN